MGKILTRIKEIGSSINKSRKEANIGFHNVKGNVGFGSNQLGFNFGEPSLPFPVRSKLQKHYKPTSKNESKSKRATIKHKSKTSSPTKTKMMPSFW